MTRPKSVKIISWLYIVFGSIGVINTLFNLIIYLDDPSAIEIYEGLPFSYFLKYYITLCIKDHHTTFFCEKRDDKFCALVLWKAYTQAY